MNDRMSLRCAETFTDRAQRFFPRRKTLSPWFSLMNAAPYSTYVK